MGSSPDILSLSENDHRRPLWLAIQKGSIRDFQKALGDMPAVDDKNTPWAFDTLLHVINWVEGNAQIKMVRALAKKGLRLDELTKIQRSDLLENSILAQAYDSLELMAGMGFSLTEDPIGQYSIASCLGRGYWAHPDLLCPDLMKNGSVVTGLTARLFPLKSNVGEIQPIGLGIENIKRFEQFEWAPESCGLFNAALFNMALFNDDTLRTLAARNEAPEALGRLMQMGLIDAGQILEESTLKQPTLETLLAGAQAWVMDQDTALAPKAHRSGMRL